jgi:hypothetical protein
VDAHTLEFSIRQICAAAAIVFAWPVFAAAQVTPAAGSTAPDDTPAIRVGVTVYPNFVVQQEPRSPTPTAT